MRSLLITCVLAVSISSLADPTEAQTHPGDGSGFCEACAIIYIVNMPVGAACLADVAGNFSICWVSGITCSGSSCGAALRQVTPELGRLAGGAGGYADVERLVRERGGALRWSESGNGIEVVDCRERVVTRLSFGPWIQEQFIVLGGSTEPRQTVSPFALREPVWES